VPGDRVNEDLSRICFPMDFQSFYWSRALFPCRPIPLRQYDERSQRSPPFKHISFERPFTTIAPADYYRSYTLAICLDFVGLTLV
jgi:hypothetical protein